LEAYNFEDLKNSRLLTDKEIINDEVEKGLHSHYENTGIEPIDFIMANKYSFNQGNVIKYIHRVGKKAGEEKKDIIKIIDYALLTAYEKGIEVGEQELHKTINSRIEWIAKRK
jgi:hypothetical protein